ncbi:hypothetical protein SAMN05920897_11426 [Alkalispirochaeta americana]|uniref:NGG1p interacting factor NIF3 n=1 Tax=Alkalispirochaeta americana TaxID=159291 RepID=A0A1N6V936_9SPIO|nr:NGG1p interacting factor NIF3 [Alkalispirochaeta americana]SIQ74394.1 hypothetical protein SAMN05920897_11426 [Alkalispirochaeta americana]
MFKLVFFVPPDHAEAVKEAVFQAGGGSYEKYDRCSWQSQGTGQFRPLSGSNPFIGRAGIGEAGQLERLEEFRVEILLPDHVALAAVEALLRAHPYEEPAYEVYRIFQHKDLSKEVMP